MTDQRAISPRTVRLGHRLSCGSLEFTPISDWMMQDVTHIGHWTMVPNAVSLETYTCQPVVADDAPLVFLGQIEETKGPHLAIEMASRTSRKHIIAGNIPTNKRGWVEAHVLSHVDGEQVRYICPDDDVQKDALLGQAAAFLMPSPWDEPFGTVMTEALACSTPVLGLNRGSVPEVVIDCKSEFVRDTLEAPIETVGRIPRLSRQACRDATTRFAGSMMKTLVALTSTAIFGQQAALSFHERGMLARQAHTG